jgi:hypothetical protein
MTKWILAVGASLLCCAAHAASVAGPALKAGDTWVYSYTTENGQRGWAQKDQQVTVERVTDQDVLITLNQKGSTQPPSEELRGLDWSHAIDINGKQQIVSQPMSFPLSEGKKWELNYTQSNPNPKLTSASFDCKYVVTGWEEVQVPAGKFNALKIECNGEWTNELAPGVNVATAAAVTQSGTATATQSQRVIPHTISGRIYRAYWYVPSVKRYVKAVEESYSTQGFRSSRLTEELDSFTPGA